MPGCISNMCAAVLPPKSSCCQEWQGSFAVRVVIRNPLLSNSITTQASRPASALCRTKHRVPLHLRVGRPLQIVSPQPAPPARTPGMEKSWCCSRATASHMASSMSSAPQARFDAKILSSVRRWWCCSLATGPSHQGAAATPWTPRCSRPRRSVHPARTAPTALGQDAHQILSCEAESSRVESCSVCIARHRSCCRRQAHCTEQRTLCRPEHSTQQHHASHKASAAMQRPAFRQPPASQEVLQLGKKLLQLGYLLIQTWEAELNSKSGSIALARPRSSCTTRSTKNMSDGNLSTGSALMGLSGSKGSTLRRYWIQFE